MLVTTWLYAKCDSCGTQEKLIDTYPAQPLPTIKFLERLTREMGWTVGQHGRMLCPACQKRKKE